MVKDLRIIGVFSLIYLAFVFIRDFGINGLETEFFYSDVNFLFKFIYTTYIYYLLVREKVSSYLIKVVFHLTILSFFFYSLQLIGFGDDIFRFSKSLNLRPEIDFPDYTNFLFFTYIRGQHEYRNAGFAWEPGAFGCFLSIVLMLNFFLNKFTFDRKSIIFIIAIITTLSTTDYLALLVLVFCAYRYRVSKLNIWVILLLLISALVVIYVPFLGDKISDTYQADMDDLNRLKSLEVFYKHTKTQIPLNRFSSMVFLYNSFGFELILGVSNKYDIILSEVFNINISNGLFDFMARFGLVGLIYLIYGYTKFCLANVLKLELLIYCIVVILMLGFGEPILAVPAILIFMFLSESTQVNTDGILKTKKRYAKPKLYI